MGRTPNTICKTCDEPCYKRPNDLKKYKNHYCTKECYFKDKRMPTKICEYCGQSFQPSHRRLKFCSRLCAQTGRNRVRRKHKYSGKNKGERFLNELLATFNFTSCMVQKCAYNKTYDLHRLIPGKVGGKYKIGNAFAICPNHHAEIHRKICKFIKKSDCELIAIYGR